MARGAQQTAAEESKAAEVIRPESAFTPEMLDGITDFDSALALAEQVHGEVVVSKGVRVADDRVKMSILGWPMILLEWVFLVSDKFGNKPREYVEMLVVVKNPETGEVSKWRMSDGSTGIYAQLRAYSDKTGRTGGVRVDQGLRVSEYKIDPKTREPLSRAQVQQYKSHNMTMDDARTFYIDVE